MEDPTIIKQGYDPKNREVSLLKKTTITEDSEINEFQVIKPLTGFLSEIITSEDEANALFDHKIDCSHNQ